MSRQQVVGGDIFHRFCEIDGFLLHSLLDLFRARIHAIRFQDNPHGRRVVKAPQLIIDLPVQQEPFFISQALPAKVVILHGVDYHTLHIEYKCIQSHITLPLFTFCPKESTLAEGGADQDNDEIRLVWIRRGKMVG